MNNNKWKIPGPIENIDIRNLEVAREEANSLLGELNKLSDTITVRAYTILSFLIPVVPILIAVLCNSSIDNELNSFIFWNSLLAILIIIVCILLFTRLVFSHNRYTIGREPKLLLTSRYIHNPEYIGDNTYRVILGVIIHQAQGAIENERKILLKRSSQLRTAIYTLIGTFIFETLSLVIQIAIIHNII